MGPNLAPRMAAVCCVILASAVAGCAGSGANSTNYVPILRYGIPLRFDALPVHVRHARSHAEVYVSDSLNNIVKGYDQKTGDLDIELTGFNTPMGLATDADGNLYVADSGNQRVLVFTPGATQPFLTLDDAGWYPTGVAVSKIGEVAVTNNMSQGSFPGSVTFFKKGRPNVFREFDGPLFAYPYFCAYDARGNLYLDAVDIDGRTSVIEVVRRPTGKVIKSLGIKNVRFPGGVQVDDSGRLLVLDQYSSILFVYVPPSRKPQEALKLNGAGDPVTVALASKDTAIYVADAQLETALRYPFPAGGDPTQQISVGGLPIGVALTQ